MKIFYSVLVLLICFSSQAKAQIRAVDVDQKTGFAKAVVVTDRALVHTSQILPFGIKGGKLGVAHPIVITNVKEQTIQVIRNLSKILKSPKSSISQLVALNVYVANEKDVMDVKASLAKVLTKEKSHPAVRFVVTSLEDKKALVAMDAIASSSYSKDKSVFVQVEAGNINGEWRKKTLTTSILRKGRALYISGMASRSKDLGKATSETLSQLKGVLKLLGLTADDVVHLKAYLKPMSDIQIVQNEVKKFSKKHTPFGPPISFVEWKNGLPIEIELIAHIPDSNKTVDRFKGVTHNWQPKEKQSPVYCRFAIVDSPTRIYLAGMTPQAGSTPEEKVKNIFKQMKETLKKTDSDLEHLVKATYYVAQDDVSSALNKVRPQFYNPKHPPAASKATVESVGEANRKISIDMIAVPAK